MDEEVRAVLRAPTHTSKHPDMHMIVDHTDLFANVCAVDGPGKVMSFEQMYYYRNCDGKMKELGIERRLKHRNDQKEAVLVSCINLEVFAVLILR